MSSELVHINVAPTQTVAHVSCKVAFIFTSYCAKENCRHQFAAIEGAGAVGRRAQQVLINCAHSGLPHALHARASIQFCALQQ